MGKTMRRVFAAATVGIMAVALSAAPAAADDPGVGVTTGEASLLSLRIGSTASPLLDLKLFSEQGSATVDARGNSGQASEGIVPLSLSLLGSNLLTLPSVNVTTTGGEQAKSTSTIDLDELLGGLGLEGLLGGAINPVAIRGLVDGLLAEASATSSLTDITALFGLVGLDTLGLGLSGAAEDGGASANRGLDLVGLDILTLDGLLGLLGLDLLNLPLDNVLGLLGFSGLGSESLLGTIAGKGDEAAFLGGLVDQLQASLLNNALCDPLEALLGELLGGTNLCDTLNNTINQVQALLEDVLDTIFDLLDPLLGSLGDMSLLSLTGISLEALTDANRTVETSSADTNASVGGIEVLGIALPLNVASVLELVNDTLDTVTNLLGLGDLLDLDLFEQNSGVNLVDGVVKAVADVTGVGLDLNLGGITGLLGNLLGGLSVGELLGGATDVLGDSAFDGLLSELGLNSLNALGQIHLGILEVSQQSTFGARALTPATPTNPTPGPGQTPGPLARTGAESTLVLLLAGVLVTGALAGRRFLVGAVVRK